MLPRSPALNVMRCARSGATIRPRDERFPIDYRLRRHGSHGLVRKSPPLALAGVTTRLPAGGRPVACRAVDERRGIMLSEQARRVLVRRCATHAVAYCWRCHREWLHDDLVPGGRGALCRNCGTDVTPTIHRHLFVCLMTWTREVQERTRAGVKQSAQLCDDAALARAERLAAGRPAFEQPPRQPRNG